MKYCPKNMLVTGGAGFIGGHFIEHVFELFPEINLINLDLMTYAGNHDLTEKHSSFYSGKYFFIKGDIQDFDTVNSILKRYDIDTIVHFAAESHVDNSIIDPACFIRTNILGTQNLLQCALKYWRDTNKLLSNKCRFHHISTDEVYGSLELELNICFTEHSQYKPSSPYSASKAASDHLVRAYNHTYGLPTLITHATNNFGPRQHSEKFIPTIIKSCYEKKHIPIYGTGENKRDWIYVKDHCEMLLIALLNAKSGSVYNIGAGKSISNINICVMICNQVKTYLTSDFNYSELITYVTDRPGHDLKYEICMDKFKQDLNDYKLTDLSSSLSHTIVHDIASLTTCV